MNGQHSSRPPSGAPIWGNCALAVHAIANAPERETSQSREGTAAHWVGSECLTHRARPHDYLGREAENGVIIDDKMVEGAAVYIADCLDVQSRFSDAQVGIEAKVHAPKTIHPDNWGTMDFGLVSMAQHHIVVSDYKHGHGKVNAEGNLQLADYAAGLIEAFELNNDRYIEDWTVEFRVVQPYCFQRSAPVDVWMGTVADLAHLWGQLAQKAHEGDQANPTATPGAHCRYCPGNVPCTAADSFTSHIVDECTGTADLSEVSGQDLAAMRDVLSDGQLIVKSRLEAVTDEIKHRLHNGDASTGLALKSVEGNRGYWKQPDNVIVAMGQQFGADLRSTKAVTPAQARGLIPKEKQSLWEKASADLSFKKSSTQLVDADSTLAARVFGKK